MTDVLLTGEAVPSGSESGAGQHVVPASEVLPNVGSRLPKTVADTLGELAHGQSRSPLGLQFAAAYAQEKDETIRELKAQLQHSAEKADLLRDQLEEARILNAQLTTAGGANKRLENFYKGAGIVGGVLIAVGTELIKSPASENAVLGWSLLCAGIAGALASIYSFRSNKS